MKKFTKLQHKDPDVNRIQRNVEDALTSTNQAILSNKAQVTASLGVVNAFSASINSFSASINAFTASVNLFSASIVTGSGVAGQVAYFTGARALTSSAGLYWDSTNFVLSGAVTLSGNVNTNSNLTVAGQISASYGFRSVLYYIMAPSNLIAPATQSNATLVNNVQRYDVLMAYSGSVAAISAKVWNSNINQGSIYTWMQVQTTGSNLNTTPVTQSTSQGTSIQTYPPGAFPFRSGSVLVPFYNTTSNWIPPGGASTTGSGIQYCFWIYT